MVVVMIKRLAASNTVFALNSVQTLLLLTRNKWFTYMLLEGKRRNYVT